ncbi:hypothetical protein P8C59_004860 [Phyllachora maydis]|uniref:Uncharacterized protein n=1 Tax=Phyllachora maydis TaxID=1825666 RepID=A0AAD9I4D0_9PEZI|nr:hypothetical protein P8C59_004860 [Phyllachora maydis]
MVSFRSRREVKRDVYCITRPRFFLVASTSGRFICRGSNNTNGCESARCAHRVHCRHGTVKRLPRTTPLKVYEVSDLVLDLDAENCPHVRAYNDEDAKEQLEHWSSAPHVDALPMKRMRTFMVHLEETTKRAGFADGWHVHRLRSDVRT